MASIAVDRTTTPRIGALHGLRRVGLAVAGIAVFWALWEGYRWFGETVGITWPFTVDATNMPVPVRRDHHPAHPRHAARAHRRASAGRAAADPVGVALGAVHGEGGVPRLRDRGARRLRPRRAACALGVAAARPAAVHRRVADRADPRGRADGGRRPGDEGRDPVGLGL